MDIDKFINTFLIVLDLIVLISLITVIVIVIGMVAG